MYTTQNKNNKSLVKNGSKTSNNKLPIFNDDTELQNFLQRNLQDSLKQLIRVSVTTMVKAEMQTLRNELPYPPSFNGYYDRHLTSPFGRIEKVPIPRFREGFSSDTTPQTLQMFESEKNRFLHIIQEMHRLGISQSKVAKLAKLCFNIKVSKDTVRSVHKELAEVEEAKLNSRPLNNICYRYLIFDGIWAKAKGYGWEDNDAVMLCAIGIRDDGKKDILGFEIARSENEESWIKFIASLIERGLDEKNLDLVISDDGAGFRAAKNHLLAKVPMQVCMVHKMRNVRAKTSNRNRKAITEGLKDIYSSNNEQEAIEKAKVLVKQWYSTEPKAMESLRYHFEDTLTYMRYPKEEWSKLRTSNVVERLFREVRRRMKVVDNSFNSIDSMNNYSATILGRLQEDYMH